MVPRINAGFLELVTPSVVVLQGLLVDPVCCRESDGAAAVESPQRQPQTSGDTAQQPAEARRPGAVRRTLEGWRIYANQPVLPAAFALALLYLTVMSLGALPCVQPGCGSQSCHECLQSGFLGSALRRVFFCSWGADVPLTRRHWRLCTLGLQTSDEGVKSCKSLGMTGAVKELAAVSRVESSYIPSLQFPSCRAADDSVPQIAGHDGGGAVAVPRRRRSRRGGGNVHIPLAA